MSELPRRPGRPRDPRLDDALLDTGLAVILERGYHATTLTEIARRVGVGTPAIYRRWPTKASLAMDIVVRVSEPEPIPDTGSIHDDLAAFIALRLRTWGTPYFRQLLMPLLMQGQADESLAAELRDRFIGYRQALVARIVRAIEAGELRSDTNPNRLVDILMGAVSMPLLFFQDLPPVEDAETIVDQVMSGFSAQARLRRRSGQEIA